MQQILSSLPVYMMVGIVAIIVIAQVNRIAGGILGALFWLAVAIVGSFAYAQGGSLGVPGVKFSQPVFYAICLLFCVLHLFTAWAALRRKRAKQEAERFVDDGDDDDEPNR